MYYSVVVFPLLLLILENAITESPVSNFLKVRIF